MTKETQAWIKEMEKNSCLKYGVESIEGDLMNRDPMVSYTLHCSDLIYLNGAFSTDQLQTLVDHMKKHQKG